MSRPLAFALASLIVLGCSSKSEDSSPVSTDAGDDTGADVLAPPPIKRDQNESELAPKRASCSFKAGAWPAETIGTEYPVGKDIPIDHVIVIMQENRSFDNYLGRLVAQGYYKEGEVDVPPAGWSNLDSKGTKVEPHPDDEYCYGVNHGWDDMHDDWDEGKNDHFVTNNEPNGQRTFFYEDDTVIPFYYALANQYAIGDRYFASVMTSTWPNRMFMMAATSFGIGDNSFVEIKDPPLLFTNLEAAGRTWKDYTDGPHQTTFFPSFGLREETVTEHLRNVRCDLMTDIANGTLPDVAYVMGDEIDDTTLKHSSDEGPSALPGIGGAWVEGIIRALMASSSWKNTVVFITYDENGGMADHVPPAPACPPDDYAPHVKGGTPLKGAFDHTGFRVPFTVVSPWARKHFVSHQVYDHSSVVRFIEARFGLPALSARDANAATPMEMFDFKSTPDLNPPKIDAHTTVPDAVLTKCGQNMELLGCK
jgi:phospholipase C